VCVCVLGEGVRIKGSIVFPLEVAATRGAIGLLCAETNIIL